MEVARGGGFGVGVLIEVALNLLLIQEGVVGQQHEVIEGQVEFVDDSATTALNFGLHEAHLKIIMHGGIAPHEEALTGQHGGVGELWEVFGLVLGQEGLDLRVSLGTLHLHALHDLLQRHLIDVFVVAVPIAVIELFVLGVHPILRVEDESWRKVNNPAPPHALNDPLGCEDDDGELLDDGLHAKIQGGGDEVRHAGQNEVLDARTGMHGYDLFEVSGGD